MRRSLTDECRCASGSEISRRYRDRCVNGAAPWRSSFLASSKTSLLSSERRRPRFACGESSEIPVRLGCGFLQHAERPADLVRHDVATDVDVISERAVCAP